MAVRAHSLNPVAISPRHGTTTGSSATSSLVSTADTGYEFTGGFEDRLDGSSGLSETGTSVRYTASDASSGVWKRFGFSLTNQVANDNPYWTDPSPESASGVGLFGGSYMPSGVSSLFDFTYYDGPGTGFSEQGRASSFGGASSLYFSQASGSFDFTQANPGDFIEVRFDFNLTPQVANTAVEVALIWATRDSGNTITSLTTTPGQPIFCGPGTVGKSKQYRSIITRYVASEEDVNSRALLAIKADHAVIVEPLTTLVTLVR